MMQYWVCSTRAGSEGLTMMTWYIHAAQPMSLPCPAKICLLYIVKVVHVKYSVY